MLANFITGYLYGLKKGRAEGGGSEKLPDERRAFLFDLTALDQDALSVMPGVKVSDLTFTSAEILGGDFYAMVIPNVGFGGAIKIDSEIVMEDPSGSTMVSPFLTSENPLYALFSVSPTLAQEFGVEPGTYAYSTSTEVKRMGIIFPA